MGRDTNSASRLQPVAIAVAALLLASGTRLARAADQKAFPTPGAAVAALVAALKAHASDQVSAILGSELAGFHVTRDESGNEIERHLFQDGFRILRLENQQDRPDTVIAHLGETAWPFPVPLVKTSKGWKFDSKAGPQAIKGRQIDRNGLAAIDRCKAYVDAQVEYFSADRMGDGHQQFAQKINSTSGKLDGLYWSGANGADESPLGPLLARAAGTETGLPGKREPLSGYYFKILTAQGDAAPSGARSYLVNGRLVAGFALVAWPAEYGVSGISTLVVNQTGIVYQKDLGPDTAQIAKAMIQFNPDSTWRKAK